MIFRRRGCKCNERGMEYAKQEADKMADRLIAMLARPVEVKLDGKIYRSRPDVR